MSGLARALLAELGPDDLAELARMLRPFLGTDDGWLGTRKAAIYAGCTVHALRHAMATGEVEFEQPAGHGGKTWFRRSALDRWRCALTVYPVDNPVRTLYGDVMSNRTTGLSHVARKRQTELRRIVNELQDAERAVKRLRGKLDRSLYVWHDDGTSITDLSLDARISRETVYKAINRYKAELASQGLLKEDQQ